ncbi:hypothetical protein Tco_0200462 [Tanacetum coccineum]
MRQKIGTPRIPQSSGPPVKVGDEAVHKELGDRIERAATTASSLEADVRNSLYVTTFTEFTLFTISPHTWTRNIQYRICYVMAWWYKSRLERLFHVMKSRMELYMENREHERMILESVEHGPLIWPTVEENGVTRTKKYAELSAAEKIQADCDMKATNIILQGLPADIYSLVNHHRVAKDLWERVQLLMVTVQQVQGRQGQNYSGHTYKGNATSSRGNAASWPGREKAMLQTQEAGQILDEEQLAFLADPGIPASQVQTVIPYNVAFQTEDLDTYDSDCDDLSTAQAVLMDNISNYGSDIVSEVPNSETYLNDMENQSVHAFQDFEQSPVMDFTNNEISSDSNIIPYSQYLQETQQASVQDTNL